MNPLHVAVIGALITDLACFVGIYPHAYAWLEDPSLKKGAVK